MTTSSRAGLTAIMALFGAALLHNHSAFAFTTFAPRTRERLAPATGARRGSTHGAARFAAGSAKVLALPPKGSTRAWATGPGGGNDEKPSLPGSGLRGVDTSNLTGNDKRDAEWFQRTAEREARGGLAWYEDPVIYIALVVLVPFFIGAWGVLTCYIPGFCAA